MDVRAINAPLLPDTSGHNVVDSFPLKTAPHEWPTRRGSATGPAMRRKKPAPDAHKTDPNTADRRGRMAAASVLVVVVSIYLQLPGGKENSRSMTKVNITGQSLIIVVT